MRERRHGAQLILEVVVGSTGKAPMARLTTAFAYTLLLSAVVAEEACDGDGSACFDGDGAEKKDTNGACSYLAFDMGVKVNTDGGCGTPGKCSMAGTAKNEYECVNGPDVGCCQWDDNELLSTCDITHVQNQMYKAADVCCDEATEICSDDGWPKSCNLGCASVMVPLVQKCVSNFPTIGLAASATPLQTATKLCPCATELMACEKV